MIYVFAYPVNDFSRDVSDREIQDAWHRGNGVKRYLPEQFCTIFNFGNFSTDEYWVRMIDDMEGFFPISYLHRDDLEFIGYETGKVPDCDMETIAGKLGSDYTEQLFWNSLPIIADMIGIPKTNNMDNEEDGNNGEETKNGNIDANGKESDKDMITHNPADIH